MFIIKVILISLYIILLFIPGYTIARNSDVLQGIFSLNDPTVVYFFLRLAALYGITLLFIQLILGAFMQPLTKVFPGLLRWHMVEGIISYGIILSHPMLYTIYTSKTIGIFNPLLTLWPNFSVQNEFYISFGRVALYLLTIGILAGLFRRSSFLSRHWRKFHILNYIVFVLVLWHSWNIGSDTHATPFVFLYPIFIVGFLTAFFYRRIYRLLKR